MSISTIRRQVKNVAYNFSDAQVKVREATSNDPWGPTTALMSEIADLTHNPMSFTEIMSMLWKRLNDHGKNWRHVYKSLVLLDYLIKCGSEKVAQQCRENIYSIETLKDFQHIEDNRDQGMNVREKAKQMVSLLYDEERLKNERAKFQLTRKRFIQNGSGISSDGKVRTVRKSDTGAGLNSTELDDARPGSAGEEEMQLQIAMALSKEENDKEEEMRKGDAVRLQLALEESRREMNRTTSLDSAPQVMISGSTLSQSAIDDLLSLGVGMPVTEPAHPVNSNPWGGPVADPWSPAPVSTLNPTTSMYPSLDSAATLDPWAPAPAATTTSSSLFNTTATTSAVAPDPWESLTESSSASAILMPTPASANFSAEALKQRKTPETFLGENSALVNLDNLMGTASIQPKPASNPFMLGSVANVTPPTVTNPFASTQRPSPTLNEMRAQRGPDGLALPLQPQPASSSASTTNPFVSF